jgi:beta-galactosidase
MKLNCWFFLYTLILFFISCSNHESQREENFNSGWKFLRADAVNAQQPDFDDASWRTLDLPHDYSIEDLPDRQASLPAQEGIKQIGPFSENSPGGASTGHTVGGTAWYRKHFTLGKADRGKRIRILFDGVYMDADYWINGHFLGNHPYGYTPFHFDLTGFLQPEGKDNLLAVRVKNEGKNSRWYSGSGIYRDVMLIKTGPVHVDIWGNAITTPEVSPERATVLISTRIMNTSSEKEDFDLKTDLKDQSGKVVASSQKKIKTAAGSGLTVVRELPVPGPGLWSPGSPSLYTAVIQILADGKVIDRVEEKFGIRSIAFSAEKGFLLNGKSVELKGGCLHHDNGPLGSAAFRPAEYRRVKIMKDNGFNAIRTSHNPPSRHFLDACDELGMLVLDESFDQWQKPKNPQDYHRFFNDWWEKDMEAMVLRDRNHPSVILWSVGNEIRERADSSGLAIFRMLSGKVRSLDPTRLVTQAVCSFWDNPGKTWEDTSPVFAQMSVGGYNYQWQQYEADHSKYPERIMIGTESVPKEAFENWQMVEKHPYVIGDFVWTGMDYLGESGIGHTKSDTDSVGFLPPWPWFVSNCGDISILGDKKPQMYYRDVVWKNSLLEMMVHAPVPEGRKEIVSFWGWPDEWKCWNWTGHEGQTLQVSVYSRCETVTLLLNGKVVGTTAVSENAKLKAIFEVPYQTGELTAIGYTGEKEVARQMLKTSGKPFMIKVSAEQPVLPDGTADLAWFGIEILDENGLPVPDAVIPVSIEITGGKLQAVANSNPRDMHSFQRPYVNTFRGKCQVIVKNTGSGDMQVTARAEGMKEGSGSLILK